MGLEFKTMCHPIYCHYFLGSKRIEKLNRPVTFVSFWVDQV